MDLSAESLTRLAGIKMVVLDVDGVLTDGSIVINADGTESKSFNVYDGSGIKYLMRAGLEVALLSGRSSPPVQHRAKALGIEEVHQGAKEKLPAFERILENRGFKPEQVCYVGDGLPDIPVMRKAGFAATVASARPEVLEAADYVTSARGGAGAVRELAELLLRTQGKWDDIMSRYR